MPFLVALFYALSFMPFSKQMVQKSWQATVTYSFVKGSSVIASGETNVKPFNCSCLYDESFPENQASLYTNDANSGVYFRNTQLNIEISALDCGNSNINKDLSKALKANQHPYIFIKLNNAVPVSGTAIDLSQQTDFKINVLISLAGMTRPAVITLHVKQTGSNRFYCKGRYELHMRDFGIKPPTAMFGMIKVRNTIVVKFNLIVSIHTKILHS